MITRVLPEPAPASTSRGPPLWLAASRCGGFSLLRSTDTKRARYGSASGSSTASLATVSRYEGLVAALREEFPKFRIIRKDRSRMHRAIHWFLYGVTFGRMRSYLD